MVFLYEDFDTTIALFGSLEYSTSRLCMNLLVFYGELTSQVTRVSSEEEKGR
jgi:hypothetical protein